MKVICRKYSGKDDYERLRELFMEGVSLLGTKFIFALADSDFGDATSSSEDYLENLDDIYKNIYYWFYDDKLVGINTFFNNRILYFFHPNNKNLFNEMIDVSEKAIKASMSEKNQFEEFKLQIFDGDTELESIAKERNYYKTEEYRTHYAFDCNTPIEIPNLPEGYHIKTVYELQDKNSLLELYPLPFGSISVKEYTLVNFTKAPSYRKELDVIVVDSDNKAVAFCSGYYDDRNKIVTFVAVACKNEHRNKGLSKAMMLHALKNAQQIGARWATVQTDDPNHYPIPNKLYKSVGFKLVGKIYFWKAKDL